MSPILETKSEPPSLFVLIMLCGLSVVSLNMFLPSLSDIATAFDASYALANLSIAGYAVMTALMQLLVGPLSDRYGRRPVMILALVLFILATIGCLSASNIWVFLAFRMLQGAVITGYTISLAIVRDSYSSQKAASLIGYIMMTSAIAPMLGPMLGGFLGELFGWRSNFWVFLTLGSALLALCLRKLQETNLTRSSTLSEQIQSYPELIRSRRFWGYVLCMAFTNGSFYVFLGGAPLVASAVFDISTSELGVFMGTTTAGFVFGSFLSGRYADTFELTTMMLAGRFVACLGLSIGMLLWFVGFTGLFVFFGACFFLGIGNGMTLPSSSAGAVSVKKELAGSAAGLSGAVAVATGALMSAVSGALITDTNVAYLLMFLMLLASAVGLAATYYVVWINKQIVAFENHT